MTQLTTITVLSVTRKAAATIQAGQFVTVEGKPAADGEQVLGVAQFGVTKGRDFVVDVLGVFDLPAGGAIARGDKLQSDSLGRPVPLAEGIPLGWALTGAANSGDIVRVMVKDVR